MMLNYASFYVVTFQLLVVSSHENVKFSYFTLLNWNRSFRIVTFLHLSIVFAYAVCHKGLTLRFALSTAGNGKREN